MSDYDSKADTVEHIREVQRNLNRCIIELMHRGNVHDLSKLYNPEKEVFDRMTPKLASLEYGSEEYKQSLKELGVALEHHYRVNSHHPEHYSNGVDGMNLFDVIEMLMDWRAASKRGKVKTLNLTHSFKRFNIDPQMQNIIRNTCDFLGWGYK